MSRRVIPFLCLFSVLIVVISVPRTARTTSPVTPSEPTTRSFEFTYQVHFPATENPAAPVRLWIPLPQSDGYQDLSNVRIESTVASEKGRDPEYKDAFTEFKPTAKQAASGFGVTLRFAATRHEHKVALARAVKDVSAPLPADPMLHRYLESDRLVPLSGVIGELAKEHTAGDTTQLEKPATSTTTSSPPCATTNPAKAGAAVTPFGPAPPSAGIARTFILFSSA